MVHYITQFFESLLIRFDMRLQRIYSDLIIHYYFMQIGDIILVFIAALELHLQGLKFPQYLLNNLIVPSLAHQVIVL